MRRILIVLLMMAVGVAHARILHVGDNTIKLSQTKTTTPALHVRVDDEVWYGNMTRCPMPMNENTDKKLRVRYNDTDYYVSDVSDYVIVDNKLIAANCNIYLESTGTQYIDTLHIPTLVTRSEMDIRFSDDAYKSTGHEDFFGVYDKFFAKTSYAMNFGANVSQNNTIFVWPCLWSNSGGSSWCTTCSININNALKTTKQTVVLDTKNNYVQYGNVSRTLQGRQTSNQHAIVLFGQRTIQNDGSEEINAYSRNDGMYIYNTKIYEDDVLVRHFVPVPCGLKIGNFVVPENGMWDIVEQKFYGNMGTGEFIYGVDG